ncbi:putative RNA-directed DNA polymerase [Helianthus annuus]|nr:putative RNA-directed DNA polymerase [Helianthus annuus]
MLADSGLPLAFWAEAVNTACYVQNRVLINPRHKKTAYEILYKIKPLISYFKVFGCPCFILNLKDSISKFAAKIDCGYFLGYSTTAKAYKVFNAWTKVVEETLDVKFNELSSMKIPANPADLFDLEKFTFENTAIKTNSAGPSEDTSPDYGYEIIIPQRSATKGKAPVVQNSCQSSTTATSTVVDQSSHLPLLPHPQTLLTKVLKQWIKVSSGPLHYHPFHHLLKPLLGHQSHQQWLAQMIHICSLHQ